MEKIFTHVTLKAKVYNYGREHEIFLSFVDDVGAIAFCDWWEFSGDGKKAFAKWLRNSEYAYILEKEGIGECR